MKIGIFLRSDISTGNHKILQLHQEFIDVLNNYNVTIIPICLCQNTDLVIKIINLCNGIIIPGGDDIDLNSIKYINYLYKQDIPTLGICLGMQEMSCLFNGKIVPINNHKSNNIYVHDVYLKESLLTKIFKKNIIKVNSRHSYKVNNTLLEVIGYCEAIEAVIAKNKNFFLGVQWHPESMYKYDLDQRLLFDYFISISGGNNVFK